jgi:predicted DNA-binding protein
LQQLREILERRQTKRNAKLSSIKLPIATDSKLKTLSNLQGVANKYVRQADLKSFGEAFKLS